MPERRYTDEEIAEIFRAATEGTESQSLPGDHAGGVTLSDLQAIARDVGISPVAVARAAQALDRPPAAAVPERFLGLPLAVERTVALDRALTDQEWELLVSQLRQVFRVRGTVRAQGSLREWSRGNLNALLEPTGSGYQLRMGTMKGGAMRSAAAGAVALAVTAATGVMAGVHGTLAQTAPMLAVLTGVGTALLANGTVRLPSWARRRREQMESIAAWLETLMSERTPPAGS
jgi:hypothetical protein